jgi:hypothetical protein
MKTGKFFVVALVLACIVSLTLSAWAVDTPKQCEKSTPTAKAKTHNEIKCVVTGKLEEKTMTNKKGKEVKVFDVVVASAKSDDGKDMKKLAGKSLRVAHKKGLKLAPFVGKDVTVSGMLIDHKRLLPESIK